MATPGDTVEDVVERVKAKMARLEQKYANPSPDMVARQKAALQAEKQSLEQQVAAVKRALIVAEIENGVKQVWVPRRSPAVEQPSAPIAAPPLKTEPKTTEAAPAVTNGDAKSPPNNNKSGKKEKKEKAPKVAPKPAEEGPIDVSRLHLRVGRIVEVSKHPDADTLFVEKVDLAEAEPRTIVSGLVKHFTLEQMQDRLAVFCCNLKPAKMRGVLSQGMIMCAAAGDRVEILTVPDGAVPGDRVTCSKFPGESDAQLNPKKKIWEQVQPDLKTNTDRLACYQGHPLEIAGKGVIQAPTIVDGVIR